MVSREDIAAVHDAVSQNNPERVKELMKKNSYLSDYEQEGLTPLCAARKSGHWDCVIAIAELLEGKKIQGDQMLISQALLNAVIANQTKAVLALLKTENYSLDVCHQRTNDHILHISVKNNNAQLTYLLKKRGAIDATNKMGQTAFDLAKQKQYWKCAHALNPQAVKLCWDDMYRQVSNLEVMQPALVGTVSVICEHAEDSHVEKMKYLASLQYAGAYLWMGQYYQRQAQKAIMEQDRKNNERSMIYCYQEAHRLGNKGAKGFLAAYDAVNKTNVSVEKEKPLVVSQVPEEKLPTDSSLIGKLQRLRINLPNSTADSHQFRLLPPPSEKKLASKHTISGTGGLHAMRKK